MMSRPLLADARRARVPVVHTHGCVRCRGWRRDLPCVCCNPRANLEGKEKSTQAELAQVERLQRKFASIHTTLAHPVKSGGGQGREASEGGDASRAPAALSEG